MRAAGLSGTHGARAHAVQGVVRQAVAVVVICGATIAIARKYCAPAGSEGAVLARAGAALADAIVVGWPAGHGCAFHATAATVRRPVAGGVIPRDRARVRRTGAHRTRASAPIAARIALPEHAQLLAGVAGPLT